MRLRRHVMRTLANTTLVILLFTAGTLGVPDTLDEPVPLIELVEDPDAPLYDWMDESHVARLQAGEPVFLEEFTRSDEYLPEELEDLPLPYTRIRPGSPLGVTQQACTANFVFQQGDRLAIGNAGHCTQLGRAHQVSILNLETQSIELLQFGTTIMRIYGGLGTDFALIEVDPEFHDLVHPAIAGLDGPCGHRATIGTGDPIQFHGHGTGGYGYYGQNRHGAVASHSDNHISYHRLPGGAGGDSGSPVRFVTPSLQDPTTAISAAGINTHGTVGNPQMGHGTSAPRIMDLIDQANVGDWDLVNSPNCPT